jgi:hypothetical protein
MKIFTSKMMGSSYAQMIHSKETVQERGYNKANIPKCAKTDVTSFRLIRIYRRNYGITEK